MKLIIAGGREFNDYELLQKAMLDHFPNIGKDDSIICGDARGADSLGNRFGIENQIPVEHFPAQWDTFGKSAGYRRNEEMARHATHLLAFWDGQSKGTLHMINIATNKKLAVIVIHY